MKKTIKTALWILVAVFFFGSSVAFIVFHSPIWKSTLRSFVQNQLKERYQLDLSIGKVQGSLFGNIEFFDLNLRTFAGYDIFKVHEANLRFGIIPLVFNRGEINLIGIDSLRFSYPRSIDSLRYYLGQQTPSKSLLHLNLKKVLLTNLLVNNSDSDPVPYLAGKRIEGTCRLLPDSVLVGVEHADLTIPSINENFTIDNTSLAMIADSILIQNCQINNRSTELNLDGLVKLDSAFQFDLNYRLNNLLLRDRFPAYAGLFTGADFLNLSGRIYNQENHYFTNLEFTGEWCGNQLSSGKLQGFLNDRDFQVSEFSCNSGKETISGSGQGRMGSGFTARSGIKNINIQKWNLGKITTSINGNFTIDLDGPVTNPERVAANLSLTHSQIDTFSVDTLQGAVEFAGGRISTIDSIRIGVKQVNVYLEGWANVDSNRVNARLSFNSQDLGSFSSLGITEDLKGRVAGLFEATGKLYNPDFRGWIKGDSLSLAGLSFENAVARLELANFREKNFGDIYLEAKNATLPLFDEPIPLTSLIIRFDRDTAIVKSLRIVGQDLDVELQGKMVSFADLFIENISAYLGGNTLKNLEPIHFSWKADTIRMNEVRFLFNNGTLVVSGEAVNQKLQTLSLYLANFDLNPLNYYLQGSPNIGGTLDGIISYVDTTETPIIYARLNLKKVALGGQRFNKVRLESRVINNQLRLENLLIEDNEKGYLNGNGTVSCHFPIKKSESIITPQDSVNLSLNFDNFGLNTFNSFLLPGLAKEGKVNGTFAVKKSLGQPICEYALSIKDPVFDKLKGDELKIKGDYRNSKLGFSDIRLQDSHGVSNGSGFLPLTVQLFPGNFIFQKDSSMYLKFSLHSSTLEFLSQYLGTVESIEGEYDLALSISGTPNNPVRSGNIIAKNGTIRFTSLENPVTGVEGSAIMDGNILKVVSLTGRMQKPMTYRGFGRIRQKLRAYTWDILFPPAVSSKESNVVVEGEIDFTEFFKPSFDIRLTGKQMYIRSLLAEQEGILDGEFSLKGCDTLQIEGDVDINELFVRNEFHGSEPLIEKESKGSGTYTNINLHTIIPGNLYFQNSQLNCELEGEMWILKSGSEPYRFSGTLNIRKGKFYYYGWEFEVVQGSINFNPLEFNPTLDIEARVNLAAYNQSESKAASPAEDYVTVMLSGDLDNPTLVFDSDKYNESDILMYLSHTTLGSEETLNQSQISTGAVNVFGMYFERQLEKNISQISGLDEFELRTRGNLLSNQQTDQWSVALGRKIAPNLYFSYERSLSLIEPDQQFGIEYRLNRNVSLSGDIEGGLWRINYLYKYRY